MKVVDNHDVLISKDTDSYYVQNTDDNRSRRDRWNAKKFVRSDSRPGYFRTVSKNAYVKDNSKFFKQGSSFRYNSRPGSKGSNKGSGGMPRSQTKSIERPKSEMFRKVEKIEKEQGEFKKSLDTIMEMLKTINTQYVEEEILINVNYVSEGQETMVLIDSSAP